MGNTLMEEALTSTAGIHVEIVLHSSPYVKRQRFTGGRLIAFESYQAVAATCSCKSTCLLLYSSITQATVALLPVTVKVHSKMIAKFKVISITWWTFRGL